MPALGTCPAGAATALIDASMLYTDNLTAFNNSLPFVTPSSPATHDDVSTLLVSDLMVTTDSGATLERVRTTLSRYANLIDPNESPLTFGEVGHLRARLYLEVQRVVTIIAGVTLLIAGCGLAIAVTSGLIERKRPFTLLRVSRDRHRRALSGGAPGDGVSADRGDDRGGRGGAACWPIRSPARWRLIGTRW